jgi:rhodanese-related sulfurtransferase
MKNKLFQLLYLLMVSSILFLYTGCSEDSATDPTPQVNESEELLKYLEANGDFMNTACPALINASDVYTAMQTSKDWPIIDLRTAAHFSSEGRIQGAVNVLPADLVTYYRANNLQNKERVILVCYTGQTAGWATSILRMLGYSNVFDMKYGMCSWNDHFASRWRNAVGNGRAGQFTTTNFPKPAAGQLPVLSTGKTTGAEILEARVQALLAEGFTAASMTQADLFQNLGGYFIVNYWSVDHYNAGHIEGSIQYTPKADLKLNAAIKTLPTDKPITVYCYTGQTSAHVAAILRALGYNAKSLNYGVNGMNYDNMPGTKWSNNDIMDYPFVL